MKHGHGFMVYYNVCCTFGHENVIIYKLNDQPVELPVIVKARMELLYVTCTRDAVKIAIQH